MNYSTYRFTLDIHKTKSQVSISVPYMDTGIQLLISLTDGGKPYIIDPGCTAVFYGKKADGTTLVTDCEIIDGVRINYIFTDQTTTCEGVVDCEIRLYSKEGLLITTPCFIITVEPRAVNDEDIILSDSERSAIDRLFESEAEREEAEEDRGNSEQARIAAELARVEAEKARGDEILRIAVEEVKRTNAENERAKSEAQRASAEEGRKTAEDRRVAAEQERERNIKKLFIRYSSSADGTGFTERWSEGQGYIGQAVAVEAPTDKNAYEWSVFNIPLAEVNSLRKEVRETTGDLSEQIEDTRNTSAHDMKLLADGNRDYPVVGGNLYLGYDGSVEGSNLIFDAAEYEEGNLSLQEGFDYRYIFQLLDREGHLMGSPIEIYIPIESVVVDGSFDADAKSLQLTLKNGNVISIPIGDIVEDLASTTYVDGKERSLLAKISEGDSANTAYTDSEIQKVSTAITNLGTSTDEKLSALEGQLSNRVEELYNDAVGKAHNELVEATDGLASQAEVNNLFNTFSIALSTVRGEVTAHTDESVQNLRIETVNHLNTLEEESRKYVDENVESINKTIAANKENSEKYTDDIAAELAQNIAKLDQDTEAYIDEKVAELKGQIKSGDDVSLAYTDRLVGDLHQYVEDGDNELDKKITALDGDLRQVISTEKTEILTQLDQRIAAQGRLITSGDAANNAYTDEKVAALEARVAELESMKVEPPITVTRGGVTYELSQDETYYTVTSYDYTRSENEITVKSDIYGVPVKRIGEGAFSESALDAIWLPDINYIESYAFSEMSNSKIFCNKCTTIPVLEDVNAFTQSSYITLFVPDELWMEWGRETNWTDIFHTSVIVNLLVYEEPEV